MAYEESLRSITLAADTSLDTVTGVPGTPGSAEPNGAFQYRFVKVTGAGIVGLATAPTTDYIIGVLQNKPQYVGSAATVAIRGVSLVVSGAGSDSQAIAAGDPLSIDTTGRAVQWDTGERLVGIALGAASIDAVLIPVLLIQD